jgi:hypothetical protein
MKFPALRRAAKAVNSERERRATAVSGSACSRSMRMIVPGPSGRGALIFAVQARSSRLSITEEPPSTHTRTPANANVPTSCSPFAVPCRSNSAQAQRLLKSVSMWTSGSRVGAASCTGEWSRLHKSSRRRRLLIINKYILRYS